MATGKTFYWLKLRKDFMTGDVVDFFMSQENGANYVVLYQLLCLNCINTNGTMASQIGDMLIEYDIDKIVRDCKYFSRDTVLVAMKLFTSLGLIFRQENGVMQIANFDSLVGSETDYAKQKREQRLQSKAKKNLTKAIEEKKNNNNSKDLSEDLTVDSTVDNVHLNRISGQNVDKNEDNVVDMPMDNVHVFEKYTDSSKDSSKDSTMDNVHTEKEIRDRERVRDINIKKEKNTKKNNDILKSSFERFWKKYPKQKNYDESYMLFIDLLKHYSIDDILVATDNYVSHTNNANFNPQYIMNSTTFLQKSNIDIYLTKYSKTKQSAKNKNTFSTSEQNAYDFDKIEMSILSNNK